MAHYLLTLWENMETIRKGVIAVRHVEIKLY